MKYEADVKNSCFSSLYDFVLRGQPLSPFCDILNEKSIHGCTISRKIVSFCNLVHKTKRVPAEYQVNVNISNYDKLEVVCNLYVIL